MAGTGERDPRERIRTLLLRGDNLLKSGKAERLPRAVEAFEQAAGIARTRRCPRRCASSWSDGSRPCALSMAERFRRLNFEQRVAAVAALLLVVSTFGPFSFVEVAELLLAAGVLALLRARADGREFHLPFGDGSVIAAAGVWAGVLIAVRLFDRPLGQNLLALACAAILFLAGARERAKRPADDLPPRPADDLPPRPADDLPPRPAPDAAPTVPLRPQPPEG